MYIFRSFQRLTRINTEIALIDYNQREMFRLFPSRSNRRVLQASSECVGGFFLEPSTVQGLPRAAVNTFQSLDSKAAVHLLRSIRGAHTTAADLHFPT